MMDGAKENPGVLGSGAVPWGLFGMAILVVGIELFVSRDDKLTTLADAEHKFAYRASREARRYEVLCFGDSQAKDGIVPRVVEARLGKRTLNLAIAGSPAPSAYFLLRRALESGARPAALLVDYHAWVLQVDPRHRVHMYAELCNLRDCVELAWTAGDANFFGSLATSVLLPSFKNRGEIRARVLAALRGASDDPKRLFVMQSERNWIANGGAQIMPRNPEVAKIHEFWDESASYPEHWESIPTNTAYITKFLGLAAANRIPVFLLVPPRHPRVQANREGLGLDALYTRFVRETTAGYPNVTVIDARHSGYDPAVFIDSSHLDRQGAYDFSDDVAAAVADRLGSRVEGRTCWVDLPRHRSRPESVALEDLTQSASSMRASSKGLRR
jgi:hypothetical protein